MTFDFHFKSKSEKLESVHCNKRFDQYDLTLFLMRK